MRNKLKTVISAIGSARLIMLIEMILEIVFAAVLLTGVALWVNIPAALIIGGVIGVAAVERNSAASGGVIRK